MSLFGFIRNRPFDPIVHRRKRQASTRQFGLSQLFALPPSPRRARAVRLYVFWCTR